MARSTSPTPLLSASLIVKDEQAVIDRCLTSLTGIVDEIVVLDTGSTDRTIALAKAHGARVISADWHDDFGRSRNESLGHCRGRWAIVIDADEVLRVSDVTGFREFLRTCRLDGLQATVDSYSDDAGTVGVSHQSIRILNRRQVHYEGRLHEQVQSNRHPRPLKLGPMPLVTLGHWGYIQRIVEERGKTERNIRICQTAIAEGAGLHGVMDLGRTLAAAGRLELAMEQFRAARESDEPFIARTALRQGIGTLLNLDRADTALTWVDALAARSTRQAGVDIVRAEVLLALGQHDEAFALYERNLGHPVLPDDDGVGRTEVSLRVDLGLAMLDLGRTAAGVEHLLQTSSAGPVSLWPRLLTALAEREEVPRAVEMLDVEGDRDRSRLVLAELAATPVPGIADLLDALDEAHPGNVLVLAFAALAAEQITVEQAVTWSARARAAGLESHCPLLGRAMGEALPPLDRLVSAGLLRELFDDPRGTTAVEAVSSLLPSGDFTEALHVLNELAPTALETFIIAATQGPGSAGRCVAMARALDHHGERDVAVSVLQTGLHASGDIDPAVTDLLTAWAS